MPQRSLRWPCMILGSRDPGASALTRCWSLQTRRFAHEVDIKVSSHNATNDINDFEAIETEIALQGQSQTSETHHDVPGFGSKKPCGFRKLSLKAALRDLNSKPARLERPSVSKSICATSTNALELPNQSSLTAGHSKALSGVSLPDHPIDSFDSSWIRRFSRLKDGQMHEIVIRDTQHLNSTLITILNPDTSPDDIRQAWASFQHGSAKSKLRLWEDIMLWSMQDNPEKALSILFVTLREDSTLEVPRYKVADCLDFLAQYFLDSGQAKDPSILKYMQCLTHDRLLADGQSVVGTYHFPDSVARLLIGHGDIKAVLEGLFRSSVNLHPNTVLHLLDKAIDRTDPTIPLRLLQSIVESRFDVSQPQIQGACVKLLRTTYDTSQEYKFRLNLLTRILEIGIRPGIVLYNAMLLTVIDSGDFELSWQMFDMIKANSLAPSSVTYGVMLRGARLSNDPKNLRRVLKEIERDSSVLRDDFRLLSDVLNCIYSRGIDHGTSALPEMLQLYQRYCNMTPLQELGIYDPETESASGSMSSKPLPTPHILGQIIGAYVMVNRKSDKIIEVYKRYHQLLEIGHPQILPIAQWDYAANGFMLAFGMRAETLRYCTVVVKDMLDGSSKSRNREERSSPSEEEALNVDLKRVLDTDQENAAQELGSKMTSRSNAPDTRTHQYYISPPTVRTWTLLARAFLNHGQQIAAEKVLKLMQDHGLRPDNVTWHTFISGYANLQNVEAAIGAVNRMQAEKHEITMATVRGLSRIWDRARLLKALGRENTDSNGHERHHTSNRSGETDAEVLKRLSDNIAEAISEKDKEQHSTQKDGSSVYNSHNHPDLRS